MLTISNEHTLWRRLWYVFCLYSQQRSLEGSLSRDDTTACSMHQLFELFYKIEWFRWWLCWKIKQIFFAIYTKPAWQFEQSLNWFSAILFAKSIMYMRGRTRICMHVCVSMWGAETPSTRYNKERAVVSMIFVFYFSSYKFTFALKELISDFNLVNVLISCTSGVGCQKSKVLLGGGIGTSLCLFFAWRGALCSLCWHHYWTFDIAQHQSCYHHLCRSNDEKGAKKNSVHSSYMVNSIIPKYIQSFWFLRWCFLMQCGIFVLSLYSLTCLVIIDGNHPLVVAVAIEENVTQPAGGGILLPQS